MKDTLKELLAIAIIFGCGVLLGYMKIKNSCEPRTEIRYEYIWGDTVVKEISVPKPYTVYLHDTIERIVVERQKIDTAQLYETWLDYHRIRRYDLDFSDDSLGVFRVDVSVSENRISDSVKAIIQPRILMVTKTETVYETKSKQSYVMMGASPDFRTMQIQAGVGIRNVLVGVSGIRMNDDLGYTINVGYKF